ncbi:MAG: hypothetical protein A2754_03265 [Candidatus Magasanikbacteria bacterium RIFCSPHIGHO2_01_FULL_47_8]|uniref:DUF192 domain-containing protein n=1 Tax=Candidatus Magasanikbacteria bacterium RIFCSPHIGHO2_01_FULL_47_8 TaxID=1798673 RepID=A0A1F6MG41_9BACT|nr:MAG: hypothetical protein A2754_03265 [Candidatus Magasanikbacteria bacterium RIFCSPHIGHO2_01_FULL_47_8]
MFTQKENRPVKKWQLLLLAAVMLTAFGVKAYGYVWSKAVVSIGGQEVKVLVADTDARRFKGWSDRKDMGRYGGMLFLFPERAQHTMVMRNMQFPLDIVWLDGNTVVDMAPNVSPEPGRAEEDLTPYFARGPSTKVLELSAGFVKMNGVKVGDVVMIKK